jgi:acyl carrier protein
VKRLLTREELTSFLSSIARPGQVVEEIDDNANLVDAGVIDSLAMLQIILYLEQSFGLELQASGINPEDLNSIAGIMAATERLPDDP